MDAHSGLLLLITAAAVGIAATIGMLRRERRQVDDVVRENPFAVSTEGMERCPSCGMGNLVGDRTCSSCGKVLPMAVPRPQTA